MMVGLQRAADRAGVSSFDHVSYVGDQVWDVVAAQTLGFEFVGVRVDGDVGRLRQAGARTVIRDFRVAEPSLFGAPSTPRL